VDIGQPALRDGPRYEDRLHLRIGALARRLDIDDRHTAIRTGQQHIGHMTAHMRAIPADEPERLRGDRGDRRVEVSQHDPGQLQTALINNQALPGRAPVPARIMPPALIPAELAHRQPRDHLVRAQVFPVAEDEDVAVIEGEDVAADDGPVGGAWRQWGSA
jgi:hypothetical protein